MSSKSLIKYFNRIVIQIHLHLVYLSISVIDNFDNVNIPSVDHHTLLRHQNKKLLANGPSYQVNNVLPASWYFNTTHDIRVSVHTNHEKKNSSTSRWTSLRTRVTHGRTNKLWYLCWVGSYWRQGVYSHVLSITCATPLNQTKHKQHLSFGQSCQKSRWIRKQTMESPHRTSWKSKSSVSPSTWTGINVQKNSGGMKVLRSHATLPNNVLFH